MAANSADWPASISSMCRWPINPAPATAIRTVFTGRLPVRSAPRRQGACDAHSPSSPVHWSTPGSLRSSAPGRLRCSLTFVSGSPVDSRFAPLLGARAPAMLTHLRLRFTGRLPVRSAPDSCPDAGFEVPGHLGLVQFIQAADGQRVPRDAEPDDDPAGDRRDDRVVPEFLAGMHIRNVQLDHRDHRGLDGIADGVRVVGVRARVVDHADGFAGLERGPELVDPIDQLALVVGLVEFERETELLCVDGAHRLDVGKGGAAVDLWFAGAEGVQVRPVEHGDGRHWHVSFSTDLIGIAPGMETAGRRRSTGRPTRCFQFAASSVPNGTQTATSTPVFRMRSYSSLGIGTASFMPRSLRWIRNVSRAVYAEIAATIASPKVMLPTVQTTVMSIESASARQVSPFTTTSGANFLSGTQALGVGPTSAA